MRKCEAHELQGQNDGSVKFGSGTKELKGRDDDLTTTKEVWLVHNNTEGDSLCGLMVIVAECAKGQQACASMFLTQFTILLLIHTKPTCSAIQNNTSPKVHGLPSPGRLWDELVGLHSHGLVHGTEWRETPCRP